MTMDDINYLRALVERRTGIVIEAGKEYLIEARLVALARRHGLASPDEVVKQLRDAVPGKLPTLVLEALTTQETSFFRDVHPFETLRTTILPALLAPRLAARRLTIWCAAASTGQEPYSVAILLRDHFPQLAGWQVRIIATDFSEDALRRAREGCFNPTEAGRGLDNGLRARHFREEADGWRIHEDIRRMVEFRQLNLVEAWPDLPEFDLILLRNVLIYLGTDAKKKILRRIHRQLRPDGFLLLGAAETTLNLVDSFAVVHLGRTTCYRPGGTPAEAPRLGSIKPQSCPADAAGARPHS